MCNHDQVRKLFESGWFNGEIVSVETEETNASEKKDAAPAEKKEAALAEKTDAAPAEKKDAAPAEKSGGASKASAKRKRVILSP